MGSKYPLMKASEIIKILETVGFQKVSQKGSHVKYRKEGNPTKTVIVPLHSEVAKGTLKSILEQAGLTLDEFLEIE